MKESNTKRSALAIFFVHTFLLSTPFYLLNAFAHLDIVGRPEIGALYIALFTLTPIISASVLTFQRNGKQGLMKLLRRIFDHKRISKKRWYLVIILLPAFLFLPPLLFIILLDYPLPSSLTPVISFPLLILFFFLLAAGEEVGWMGYAFEPMESFYGAVRAALILGLIWALWHLPFFIFMMPNPLVLITQFLALVGTRVLVVWIFNNAGNSVFATILFHAFGNVALMTLPEINSIIPWGSIIYCAFVLMTALIVTWLWGAKTLAKYRFITH